jgi:hypothetical protein
MSTKTNQELRNAIEMHHRAPLYQRVPTRDELGRPLGDFMMLFPGLRDLAEAHLKETIDTLAAVLGQYREVVYVDLNVPLNLLWVSLQHRPGLVLEVSSVVKAHLPQAKLIGVPPEALVRKSR